ncbi:MAG: single-strand DNA-binding protein [Frankiales bacterium]|jgi:single-strand DNA-binding protein|nr:single-strand DNA-binding protein [Frankiales bacterium]MDX6273873.1 single-strand DNA-binding protein [Frankiales bacterium]
MLSSYITVVGNVASEPRMEAGEKGERCFFRVASTERRLDKETGKWVDHVTTWFSVTVWREMAENVLRTLHKGDRVVVAGRLRSHEYVKKDGTPGTSLEIDVDAIGPDLKWRGATIDRTERSKPGAVEAAESGEWSTPRVDADPFGGEILPSASVSGEPEVATAAA